MLDEKAKEGIGAALGRIPSGLFILTAKHEDRRAGILCSWVQQACFEPPMVCVAVQKGRPIMPLISESRRFGLCQLPKGEKMMMRRFAGGTGPGEDPFLGFELHQPATSLVPILTHSMSYLECELAAHMDVEGDHDLFIGIVKAGQYFQGEPAVHVRENGFRY